MQARPLWLILALALGVSGMAAGAGGATGYVRVRALIDGTSQIVIQGNQVYWQHDHFAGPGMLAFQTLPTDLESDNDLPGVLPQITAWCPDWVNGCNTCRGDCGELRIRIDSLPFTGLEPALPGPELLAVSLEPVQCRYLCTLVEAPSAANGWAAKILFNDDPPPGGEFYDVFLRYEFTACGDPPVVTPRADPDGFATRLWPPDHGYRAITLADCVEGVTDDCDGDLDIAQVGRIVRITSDEPDDARGNGDGATCADARIDGPATALLRAERQGGGDGRVYAIHFVATDSGGLETAGVCRVGVPHDASGLAPVEGEPAYCVGSGCGAAPGPSPACR